MGRVPYGFPFSPEVSMSIRRSLSLVALLTLAAVTACSDVTGPQPSGFCQITGGPGTCGPGATTVQK